MKQYVLDILSKGYLLSLGTSDADGVWVADVIYTYDDQFNIYWMSSSKGRHSRAIDQVNSQVAGTITLTSGPEQPDMGLQLAGHAQQIKEIPWPAVLHYFRKRNKPEPIEGEDIVGERSWYKITPDRIELICRPEFGFERKRIL
jgi:uncharacterized protein YhbP (UPF0306 family)